MSQMSPIYLTQSCRQKDVGSRRKGVWFGLVSSGIPGIPKEWFQDDTKLHRGDTDSFFHWYMDTFNLSVNIRLHFPSTSLDGFTHSPRPLWLQWASGADCLSFANIKWPLKAAGWTCVACSTDFQDCYYLQVTHVSTLVDISGPRNVCTL